LILDEPLSGLDPVNSLLIKNEILALKKNKTSIILSTHDMNSVEEICDEVAIINNSKKILQGSISDIKESYNENLWTVKYKGTQMSLTNAEWGGWEMINNESINEHTNQAEIKLLNDFTINNFIKGLIDHVEILEINKKIPSINDVFIKATSDE
jgi:ABC-2 type transport system ATP-binding protein